MRPRCSWSALRSLIESDTSIFCLGAALQCAVVTRAGTAVGGGELSEELNSLASSRPSCCAAKPVQLLRQAGEEPPEWDAPPAPAPVLTLAGGLRREAESVDWGGRLDELEAQFPGIADRVTSRFEALHRAQATEGFAKDRWRLVKDTQDALPDAEVRHWYLELWQTALEEEAGIADLPDAGHAQLLLSPQVRMVAAWTASRVTRPAERLDDGAIPEALTHGHMPAGGGSRSSSASASRATATGRR